MAMLGLWFRIFFFQKSPTKTKRSFLWREKVIEVPKSAKVVGSRSAGQQRRATAWLRLVYLCTGWRVSNKVASLPRGKLWFKTWSEGCVIIRLGAVSSPVLLFCYATCVSNCLMRFMLRCSLPRVRNSKFEIAHVWRWWWWQWWEWWWWRWWWRWWE